MERSEAIVRAARGCIGARFRAQGRDPDLGLDCIGLAGFAFAAAGVKLRLPSDYALRGRARERLARAAAEFGFTSVAPGKEAAGDLLLMRTGPGQEHLAIRSAYGIIHADARLRRVVELKGAAPWPIVAAWRAPEER